MSPLTIALSVIVASLLVLLFLQPRKKGLPPGPTGLPLIGNLLNLISENSTEYFSRMSQKHGPLMSIQLGTQRIVVINSQEWLYQAFVKQGDHFNHRHHSTVIYFITNGRGIAMAEGQKWKDSRRITVQLLRDFGLGKTSIENYVNLELQTLLDTLHEKVNKPVDLHHDLSTAVLNIVWHMLVGEQFKMGDPTLHWIIDSLEQTLNLVEQGGFLNFTPVLQFIGTFFQPKAFRVLFSMIHRIRYFYRLIKTHNEKMDDPARSHDLIYVFLEEQKRLKKLGQPLGTFTDSQLVWLLSDLFIVGLDTTVTTLRWSVLFFITRPKVTQKLIEEIDSVIGSERKPCLNDRDNMPYMEAFINEVMRFSTITPLAAHATPEDTTLGEYHIPKQTLVIANLWGIHHDPKVWGDPHEFRPERFLGPEGKAMLKHLVPFSLGRRNCLGESLARTEIFLFLTSLLQQFTFVQHGDKPSEKFNHGILMHPVHHKVILKHRQHDHPQKNSSSDGIHSAFSC
ncbi:Cytochrome P450 CYP3216A1 [Hyalella azteca]|uniref:Cytochrome P450 2J2 n=1 Tax=Hyalella azteca TaxID=294128 RepID=A0A6A0H1G5_HYAAZ|nr:cytochrome P450 2J2 [Hyalella azteca]KAA0194234.1 Cytochrome P450 CYP3216A1 [Hyalella azteca]